MPDTFNQNELANLISKLPGMLYRCRYDDDWTMEFISEGCHALTGYETKALIHNSELSYAEMIHHEDSERIADEVDRALLAHEPFSYEYRIVTREGVLKWVWEQGVGIYGDDGDIMYIEGFITDITSQRIAREHLQNELGEKDKELTINLALLNEYRKAVDASAIVSKTDPSGRITYVNDAFCRVSGYPKEELVGSFHSLVRHPDVEDAFYQELWETILNKEIWQGVIKNRTKAGKTYYVKSNIIPILDHHGEIREFMSIRSDVTDLIEQKKRIHFQTTDFLTRLPNRQKLLEDLEGDRLLKLGVINIERFKEINEYYGFEAGDQLIVAITNLIQKLLDKTGVSLYKLTGDEFALLADETCSKKEFVSICIRVLDALKIHPFKIEEHRIHINAFGGASLRRNYFINAEMAVNYAKEQGKGFLLFDENLDIKERLDHNVMWTNRLKDALDNDRIILVAQPIMGDGSVEQYECLVRMVDDSGTLVLPAAFLGVAKKSRLYDELTRRVIAKACKHFEHRSAHFSINLTFDDILNKETVLFLQQTLQIYKGIGERMTLEIVESEGIKNFSEVNAFIEQMRDYGCQIAIDDFGTGYSNFDYLMRLNVDVIKIDGSIIKNLDHDRNAQVVSELIVGFAKRLGIKTVGEYVHSKAILEATQKMGIDYAQGFYLGKPERLR